MARILGIDIDSESLRAAVVRTALRRVELERVLQIPLTQRPGSPGRLVELTEAVRGLFAALGTPPDTIVAAMPGDIASLRTVELPASAAKRVAEILPFELETLLPFEPTDAVIDHQPLDARDAGQVRVLAAAVPRERVRAALAELAAVGLDPRELAVGAAALDALPVLMPELAREDGVLLVELASERTDLCLLERGRCVLTRTISLGSHALPRAAEELAKEIQRTLAGHLAAGGTAPARALLCGVGADSRGATAWFAHALACPVERLALPVPQGAEAPAPVFARAVALAARAVHGGRRINLRKGDFAPSRGAMRLADHLQLAVTCVVVIVMSATFSLKSRQSLLADERAALRAQLSTITTEVFGSASTDPAQVQTLVQNRESGDPLPRFDAFDALAAVSAAVPPDVTHEIRRLRIDLADEKREGTLELQGTVRTIQDRDRVIAELTKHECIKDIQPRNATPSGDQYNYTLEATLRCPGQEAPGKTKKRGGEP